MRPERAAHHRHVARLIGDALLLLVALVMLLIDDDQAEIGEGQEERRAGADHELRLALGDRAPDAPAHRRADMPECHSAGRAPKRSSQRVMNWLVSAISGISTSACLPLRERLGDGLEIDFGLAGAGDAVEQGHAEARAEMRREFAGRFRLLGRRGATAPSPGRNPAAPRDASSSVISVPASTRPSITPGLTPGGFGERGFRPDQAVARGLDHAARGPASCAQAVGL